MTRCFMRLELDQLNNDEFWMRSNDTVLRFTIREFGILDWRVATDQIPYTMMMEGIFSNNSPVVFTNISPMSNEIEVY
ncbi:hypothetical protein HAX54_008027 [Datura stramonium]|uniref:Uncharacterized protein n=1 Tax=Datura stramonium TaxID=4076 RepID=A0ABS8TCJ6_DATST|nr:hypothetical protein [Datura stramonium]